MMSQSHQSFSLQLPVEILNIIIEFLIPDPVPIALPPSHPTARTLRSLACVSRITHVAAIPYLYSHCVFIDSFARLQGLTETLMRAQTGLELSNQDQSVKELRTPVTKHMTSLYLGPFFSGHTWVNHDQLEMICRFLQLLDTSAVKRLILRIPQGRTYSFGPNDDAFESLRTTLMKFTSMEVFASLHSDVLRYTHPRSPKVLNPREAIPWMHWPNLRVLALWTLDPHLDLWKWWRSMKKLERVFCTDGNFQDIEENFWQWSHDASSGSDQKELELVVVSSTGQRTKANAWVFLGNERSTRRDSLRITELDLPFERKVWLGNIYFRQLVWNWASGRLLEGYETAST